MDGLRTHTKNNSPCRLKYFIEWKLVTYQITVTNGTNLHFEVTHSFNGRLFSAIMFDKFLQNSLHIVDW